MNFNKYHVSKNLINVQPFTIESDSSSHYIPLLSGTLSTGTYTFSLNQDSNLTSALRNTIKITIGGTTYFESPIENYHLQSGQHKMTFTISDNSQSVEIVYWGNALSNDCLYSNIMLNTGSTALPYEPYSSEVWHDISHYIHNTATDTITTLPAVLYPNATTATVELKGNTVQNGTPTPDSPIMLQGTGDKTANLFDIANVSRVGDLTVNGTTITKGSTTYNIDLFSGTSGASTAMSNKSLVLEAGTYTLSCDVVTGAVNMFLIVVCPYTSVTLEPVDKYFDGHNGKSFTLAEKSYVSFRIQQNTAVEVKDIMITSGSQSPTSYIPYGYKIPISSANTTTPVYLGEVESTRRIKKLVLTGEEDITSSGGDNNRVVGHFNIPNMGINASKTGYCNILLWKSEYSQSEYNRIVAYNSTHFYMSLEKTILPTPTFGGFISYLQQQYAAGTPVTIWYVLATPKTAAINEPLMKIGNYADTINNITIPVTAGGDTLSVDTTVQPSGVAINYKGWHDAKCKEYSYNMTIADWESASISQMENHTIQELQGGNWV